MGTAAGILISGTEVETRIISYALPVTVWNSFLYRLQVAFFYVEAILSFQRYIIEVLLGAPLFGINHMKTFVPEKVGKGL